MILAQLFGQDPWAGQDAASFCRDQKIGTFYEQYLKGLKKLDDLKEKGDVDSVEEVAGQIKKKRSDN
jgi:hypothetical protein